MAEQFDPAQGVDLGVQVPHPDTHLQQIVGEVLGHLLGQRGDQDPLIACGAGPDLADQVVDLAFGGLNHDLRVDQPGGPDHLLDELPTGLGEFVGPRGGRQVDRLPDPLAELLPGQRAVVGCRRQPESELDEVALAGHIALEHRADLRNSDMGLVDHQQEVLGEVVQQGRRRRTGLTAVDVAGVVLDT